MHAPLRRTDYPRYDVTLLRVFERRGIVAPIPKGRTHPVPKSIGALVAQLSHLTALAKKLSTIEASTASVVNDYASMLYYLIKRFGCTDVELADEVLPPFLHHGNQIRCRGLMDELIATLNNAVILNVNAALADMGQLSAKGSSTEHDAAPLVASAVVKAAFKRLAFAAEFSCSIDALLDEFTTYSPLPDLKLAEVKIMMEFALAVTRYLFARLTSGSNHSPLAKLAASAASIGVPTGGPACDAAVRNAPKAMLALAFFHQAEALYAGSKVPEMEKVLGYIDAAHANASEVTAKCSSVASGAETLAKLIPMWSTFAETIHERRDELHRENGLVYFAKPTALSKLADIPVQEAPVTTPSKASSVPNPTRGDPFSSVLPTADEILAGEAVAKRDRREKEELVEKCSALMAQIEKQAALINDRITNTSTMKKVSTTAAAAAKLVESCGMSIAASIRSTLETLEGRALLLERLEREITDVRSELRAASEAPSAPSAAARKPSPGLFGRLVAGIVSLAKGKTAAERYTEHGPKVQENVRTLKRRVKDLLDSRSSSSTGPPSLLSMFPLSQVAAVSDLIPPHLQRVRAKCSDISVVFSEAEALLSGGSVEDAQRARGLLKELSGALDDAVADWEAAEAGRAQLEQKPPASHTAVTAAIDVFDAIRKELSLVEAHIADAQLALSELHAAVADLPEDVSETKKPQPPPQPPVALPATTSRGAKGKTGSPAVAGAKHQREPSVKSQEEEEDRVPPYIAATQPPAAAPTMPLQKVAPSRTTGPRAAVSSTLLQRVTAMAQTPTTSLRTDVAPLGDDLDVVIEKKRKRK